MNTYSKYSSVPNLGKMGVIANVQILIGVIIAVWNTLIILLTLGEYGILVEGFYVLWIAIGIFLVYLGVRNKKYKTLFFEYSAKLRGSKEAARHDYAVVARVMGKDIGTVQKDAKFFIRHKLWDEIYGGENTLLKQDLDSHQKFINEKDHWVSVICNSCGASYNVNVYNKNSVCGHCGSSLVDEAVKAMNENKNK